MLTSVTEDSTIKEVTIIYYSEQSLELKHSVELFPQLNNGRVVIPDHYKAEKSIIAVCEGCVKILNKFGERIEFGEPCHQMM